MSDWSNFRRDRLSRMARECPTVLDFGQSARELKSLFADVEYVTSDIDPGINPDILGDICDLHQVADASFDGVICIAVLEHVYDPFKAVAEIRRILKPGGLFFGQVPFVYPYHSHGANYRDYWRFSHDGVAQLCRDFTNLEMTPIRGAASTLANFLPPPLSRIQQHLGWLDRRFSDRQVSGYFFLCAK